MTISTENVREDYTGNASTTVFPYGFKINSSAHLKVVVADSDGAETTLTVDTHYTVSGVGVSTGGNVTTLDLTSIVGAEELPADWTMAITRVVPIKQETELEDQGPYFATTQEAAFDYMTMIAQQQQEQLNRCAKLPFGSEATEGLYMEIITTSAASASASAAEALVSETSASAAAASALLSQGSASTSAASASTSAASASTSAAEALLSQGSASTSAASASTSAAEALLSQGSASTSAASASTSAAEALLSANTASAAVVDVAGAILAAGSASVSAASASASAAEALLSEGTASAAAASALLSEGTASAAAASALLSEGTASAAAASALLSQGSASTSAASASTSAASASTSAASASTSAASASTSAASASTSAASASASVAAANLPSSLTGEAGNILQVNETEDAYQFVSGIQSGVTPLVCSYKHTAALSVSSATQTLIQWDTSITDTDSVMASGIVTIPAGKAGLYLVSTNIGYQAASWSGKYADAIIFKNGAEYAKSRVSYGAGANINTNLAGVLVSLGVGDTIQIKTNHNVGSSVSLQGADYNNFSLYQIIDSNTVSSKVICSYKLTATTSISNATPTKLLWDSAIADSDGMMGSGDGIATIPADKGGNYLISTNIGYQSATWSGKYMDAIIQINGTDIAKSRMSQSTTVNLNTNLGGVLLSLSAGDEITIWTNHNQGGAVSLQGADYNNVSIIGI